MIHNVSMAKQPCWRCSTCLKKLNIWKYTNIQIYKYTKYSYRYARCLRAVSCIVVPSQIHSFVLLLFSANPAFFKTADFLYDTENACGEWGVFHAVWFLTRNELDNVSNITMYTNKSTNTSHNWKPWKPWRLLVVSSSSCWYWRPHVCVVTLC